MDDLIGFLIYALIIVIGAVASAVQAKKKAQNARKPLVRKPSAEAETMPPFFDVLNDKRIEEIFGAPPQTTGRNPFEPAHDSVEAGPSVEESYDERYFKKNIEEGPSVEEGGSEAEKIPVYLSIEDHIRKQRKTGQGDISNLYEEGVSAFDNEVNEIESDIIAAGEIVSEEATAEAERKYQKDKVRKDWRQAIIYAEILKRRDN
jgi:hypothetical protein